MINDEVSNSATGAMLGTVCGFVASVPGGPVNVAILHEGSRRGFRWAFYIGLGAVVMESIYCALALLGFEPLFRSRTLVAAMELGSLFLMVWLGVKYLRGNPLPGEIRGVEMVEHRLHPHTAFWIGFTRVLGNPGLLLLWFIVAGALLSHQWLANRWNAKGTFIAGVAAGGILWFLLASWCVSRGRGKYSDKTLRRMSEFSGLFLLATAVAIGIRIVLLLRNR